MKNLTLTLACVFMLFAGSAFSDLFPTSQGRWTLGGSASFPFVYNKYRDAYFNYSLRPEGGYFVLDCLELSLGFTATNVLNFDFKEEAVLVQPANFYWGVRFGATYYVPIWESVQPYFGAEIETLMVSFELKQLLWSVRFPIGVTYFLNRNVALNFGIPVSIDFSSTAKFEKVSVNPGYLGLKVLL